MMQRLRSPSTARLLVTSAIVLAYAGLLAWFSPFTADDSYIVARYGRNLADSGQFVFNSNEHITALTSPLEGLLAAALHLVFGSSITATKLLGAIAVISAVCYASSTLRHRVDRVLFLCLTLLSPFVAVWTVGGLETPFLLALVTTVVVLTARQSVAHNRRAMLVSALVGVAFLTRYDSILFTGPALLALAARSPRSVRSVLAALVPAAVIALAWLVFSRSYFGDIWPTSRYVKAPTLSGSVVRDGVVYEVQALVLSGIGLLFLPALGALFTRKRPDVLARLRNRWWLILGLCMIGAYGSVTDLVHMMFSYRMFVPYLPAIALLGLELARPALDGWSFPSRRRRWVGAAVVGVLALQGVCAAAVFWHGLNPSAVGEYRRVSLERYGDDFLPALRDLAQAVERHWHAQPGRSARVPRVQTFTAGVVPFELTRSYTYEMLVSYRDRCRYDTRTSADYLHVMWPAFGPLSTQLPKGRNWELVYSRTMSFDGSTQHMQVYFQRHPAPNRLPDTVNAPCIGAL